MISGGIEYYECAPDNKRIYKQTTDGYGTWTLYGAHGERVGTFGLGAAGPQDMGPGVGAQYRYDISVSGKSILFAGRMIQEAGASQKIDRLGSNRSNGARYYPYGEEIGSTANNHVKFATYTRDGFTGLDYADQRFYASTYGRFNTPDRLGGKLADPGSLNKYSYVRGDPVNRNDPKGLCDTVVAGIASAAGNPSSAAVLNYGNQAGAITVFPYSLDSNTSNLLNQTLSVFSGVLQVAQKLGPTSSTYATVLGLIVASQDGNPINVTAYSGGAGSFTAAVNFLNENGGSAVVNMINNITYIDPGGTGSLYDNGKAITLTAGGAANSAVALGLWTTPPNVITDTNPSCAGKHDFGCIAQDFAALLAQRSGPACSNQQFINQEDGIQFQNRFRDIDPSNDYWDPPPASLEN